MSDNRVADLLFAFGVGLVAGAVTALMIAPASGEETRRRIGAFAHDTAERARGGADTARDFVRDQARRLEHAFEEGKEAYLRETSKS